LSVGAIIHITVRDGASGVRGRGGAAPLADWFHGLVFGRFDSTQLQSFATAIAIPFAVDGHGVPFQIFNRSEITVWQGFARRQDPDEHGGIVSGTIYNLSEGKDTLKRHGG
jgi:hypothetical protein